MDLEVLTAAGEKTGRTVSIPSSWLKRSSDHSDHVVYLDVKRHMAAQRQGTHKTKERGEIRGSTRKIKKQKGTGTARAGSIKSPIFRGGGRVFGPRPRSYALYTSKKVRRLARQTALADKLTGGACTVVEHFSFEKPATARYVEILSKLSLQDKRSLLVLDELQKPLYMSSRNLKQASVQVADSLNTYEVLRHEHLIFFEGAIKRLKEFFS